MENKESVPGQSKFKAKRTNDEKLDEIQIKSIEKEYLDRVFKKLTDLGK